MNCVHCGTALPDGALFCGECGRAVSTESVAVTTRAGNAPVRERSTADRGQQPIAVPTRWAEDPVVGESVVPEAAPVASIPVLGAGQTICAQCGSIMSHDDIFCGECGFVSKSVTQAFTGGIFIDATQQLKFEPDAAEALPVSLPTAVPASPPASSPAAPIATAPIATAPIATAPIATASVARPPIPPAPIPLTPIAPPELQQPPQRTPVRRAFVAEENIEDLEATRIVSRASGNRFVLQFSTGENVTVHGTGLIGRNPQAEPGEYFDQLVRVLDSGKSVSKIHLEFGQEAGEFWIKDRFSGNGTVLREPDVSPRRAEGGRRYRIARGTRIDVGEQFFVVS